MASRSVVFIRSSQCGVGAPCIQLFTPPFAINHGKWVQSIVLWEACTSYPHEDRLFVKIRLAGWRRVASALPLCKRAVCAQGPARPGPPSGLLQMAELVSTQSERGCRAVSHSAAEGQVLLGEKHPGVTWYLEMLDVLISFTFYLSLSVFSIFFSSFSPACLRYS